LRTDRQEGDIAGTKLKKFSKFIKDKLRKYFVVKVEEFEYDGEKGAEVYFILKSLKEIDLIGPPVKSDNKRLMKSLDKHIRAFKREHDKIYEKFGNLYAPFKVDFTGKEFVKGWVKKHKKQMKDMGIIELKIC